MEHFLEVMGNFMTHYVHRRLRALTAEGGLWRGPFASTRAYLKSACALLERWAGVLHMATGSLWPTNGTRPWRGKPFVDSAARALAARLEELLAQRGTVVSLGIQPPLYLNDKWHEAHG